MKLKKDADYLEISRESVFGEIGALLQTVENMFKTHEDNTKSLVLLNDAQIECLPSSIVDISMFFIRNILPSQQKLTEQAIKLLSDKLSKAENEQK